MGTLILTITLFLASISIFSQKLIDSIPIQTVDNLIFFKLHINNTNEPLIFMFESGTGVTVIDTEFSKKLSTEPRSCA